MFSSKAYLLAFTILIASFIAIVKAVPSGRDPLDRVPDSHEKIGAGSDVPPEVKHHIIPRDNDC
ncbi:hypothetical protein EUX98_g7283 [Antrodiella citrinella]|uniref:Uncharacterized protein n=1 Tax=Antrodiella citrinella TaxID=2447956 RepID=A0A4S4MLX8_9APHY|nr:hypothetical protein EUX98_g7283 [Antrodiella citrinella]